MQEVASRFQASIPSGMGAPVFILLYHFSITAETTRWWILRVFHHVFLSLLGLYFGYFPFRAELFPPDGSLFLQCRQCSGEFVTPL